jgi:hypothetical protein
MAIIIGQGGNGNLLSNDKSITANTTIDTSYNYASIGPVTINSGVTVTVNSGAYWTLI